MKASNRDRAFVAGWRFGAKEGGNVSARLAAEVLRDLEIPATSETENAFCNGAEDGARGDTFRLDLGREAGIEAYARARCAGRDA